MRSVYRTVVVKKELSRKAKLSIYRSIYVPTLTYGHELWGWLGAPLEIGVRSSVTREELGVEPLLLRIERSQLRWLGHLFRMPPGRLPREVFLGKHVPPGGGLGEDPGHAGETMSLGWPGNASGSPGRAGGSVWGEGSLGISAQTAASATRSRTKADEEDEEDEDKQENEHKRSGINMAASVQKANEAKSLISQRSFNPRDIFKQKEQSFEASDRPAARSGKLQSPFLSQKSFERETPAQPQSTPAYIPHLSPAVSTSPVAHVAPAPAVSLTPPQTSSSPFLTADAGTTEEEEWSDEFDEVTPEETAQEDLYDASLPAGMEDDLYENVFQDPPTGEEMKEGGQDICARALYDYQAVFDDTEITFDPDDIITGIEMVDEGWWRGYGPDGHYGMFPANYVELL
ncbi:hypothetical protein L3Q82_002194 [Scortum barcoo]|uniref:Uncharacterized protein n=1 Tax=Scortum barcoo TaxID=214431 RepID=A0ACB8W2G6_9TELE|nr:hypothetical protein L3Q82_002194 [Scortum barcoo]